MDVMQRSIHSYRTHDNLKAGDNLGRRIGQTLTRAACGSPAIVPTLKKVVPTMAGEPFFARIQQL